MFSMLFTVVSTVLSVVITQLKTGGIKHMTQQEKNKLKCRKVHYIVWLVSNVHIFEYILVTCRQNINQTYS